MAKLRFGTGGIPLTTKNRSIEEGVKRIRELGLDAMELEFVHSVFLDEEKAESLREVAEKEDVILTVHGSYYVNLASEDKQKWNAGVSRIAKAAKIGSIAGAKYLTFHSGFRQGREDNVVYDLIKRGIGKIVDIVEKEELDIKITPELTGKASQWGDLEELIQLVKEFDHPKLGFCFDFAHKHARDGGGFNSREEFEEMLSLIEKELGKRFSENMHIHISGINYSEKGERNHLTLIGEFENYEKNGIVLPEIEKDYDNLRKKGKIGPADMEWRQLLVVLKENDIGGVIICESPNLEHDALLMRNYYQQI
ncbi:TIM barrel protein [Candidatus Dojkabacteria bacterium]|nr:TIM barrel protein [Candidatus Dojkabacteria bacterium]